MKRMAFVALTKGLFALIDSRDRRAVGRHKWQVKLRPRGTAYAVTTFRDADGRRRFVSLHRLLWELHGGESTPIVDHKNGWGLDCRWSNLRAATALQNAWNTSVHRDSSAGVKGVSWSKSKRRWVARLTRNGKRVTIACCRSKAIAAAAYSVAVHQAHGEFARTS